MKLDGQNRKQRLFAQVRPLTLRGDGKQRLFAQVRPLIMRGRGRRVVQSPQILRGGGP